MGLLLITRECGARVDKLFLILCCLGLKKSEALPADREAGCGNSNRNRPESSECIARRLRSFLSK